MSQIFKSCDNRMRCAWCAATDEYIHYHDTEWGYPVSNDIKLFEKLCLEGFQSGLSWRTILSKRDNFRKAFDGFDFNKIALFSEENVKRLLTDQGIVRHRGKIEATINNAKRAKEMVDEFGSIAAYIWRYEPDANSLDAPQTASTSEESIAISKDLKKRGWKFVGPTTVYAFMQAMGLINDHAEGCEFREKAFELRKNFKKPK
ncbi:DNA-3-methyladenine glycosylase I [Kordiimonas laminariae]|uniref:DNA-3-methyladenine glycosylase I n=1 Tax=Kordiimonas laminariae TaxID=2917717 RepID=UPI001FF31B9D|nr:DNA-3-methyladenine glycosylase I [Kordiimonas laminariae]MCK0071231.1 DNA-3-methyladenine glycosylase I [Kordiimonas laminariae]